MNMYSFEEAIELMKHGAKVRRASWKDESTQQVPDL